MKTSGKILKKIPFPENRKMKEKLLTGDDAKIAEYAGLSKFTIRDTLNGYRRLTDEAARAFIRLMDERAKLHDEISKIVND